MGLTRRDFLKLTAAGAFSILSSTKAASLTGIVPESPYAAFSAMLHTHNDPGLDGVKAIIRDIDREVLDPTAACSLFGRDFAYSGMFWEQLPFTLYQNGDDHHIGTLPLEGIALSLQPRYILDEHTVFNKDLDDLYRRPQLTDILNTLTFFPEQQDTIALPLYIKHLYKWSFGLTLDQQSIKPKHDAGIITDISYIGKKKGTVIGIDETNWALTVTRHGKRDHLVYPKRKRAPDIIIPWGFVKRLEYAKVSYPAHGQPLSLEIPLQEYIEETRDKKFTTNRCLNKEGEIIYLYPNNNFVRPNGETLGLLLDKILDGATSTKEKVERATHFCQTFLPYQDADLKYEDTRTPLQILINGQKDCSDGSMLLASMLLNERIGVRPIFITEQYDDFYHLALGIPASVMGNPKRKTYTYDGERYLYTETTKRSEIGLVSDGTPILYEHAQPPAFLSTRK